MALGLQPPTQEKSFSDFLAQMPKDDALSPAAIEKKGADELEQLKKDRQPLLDKQNANIAKMFENAEALKKIKPPAEPKLKDIQDAPDSQYKDPMQALGSMASVLAIIGSLKTRAPLTTALNAGAAAMEGFHAGDVERVKLERAKWHDNMEMGLKQNQIELDKYNAALRSANFDIAKARPMFEAIAAENDHILMLIAVQQGDIKSMADIHKEAGRMQEKLFDLYTKDQEKRIQLTIQEKRDQQAAADRQQRERHAAQAHSDAQANTAATREQTRTWHEVQRGDLNTRWFIANAQKQVKPYQETIRKANDIESNLIAGMEMPDTVKVQLKQLAGTRQVGRWTQGLDKNTGDIITRIFSKLQAGTMGTLSEQDANAMRAFTDNIKAINGQEIEKIKQSMKPYAEQYKIPEKIFDLPFSSSSPMGDIDLAYPGLDQSAADALGIARDMVGQ